MIEKNKYKQRSGSAILLALMVMFALLSSVLYINVLSLRSMKQAQNIDNSIIAFYAAETGNEQAVYYIRKSDNLDISDLQVPHGSFSGPDNLIIRELSDSTKNILIGLKKDEVYQLDIFNQNDLSQSSNLSYLTLNWDQNCLLGAKLELTVNQWLAGNNIQWGQMQNISKCILSTAPVKIDNSGSICPDIILDKHNSYQFRFKALNCGINNLSIKAFDSNNQQISFKNIYNIKSVGEYPLNGSQANRQALQVNLRKSSPLSALFDYVLFSEKSLVKDIGVDNGGWFSDDLFIATDSLPDAELYHSYSYALSAVNGTPPYTWSLAGTIPKGLKIDPENGILLSDKILEAGVFPLIITVRDDNSQDSKTLFLTVNK